jgi:hypothetical protein
VGIDAVRTVERQGESTPAVDRTASAPATTLARCPTCAGGLARLDSGMRADLLLDLQRSHGNAFVGGLAARAKEGACTCGGRCGGGVTLAREPKKVTARPKDPSKPMELMSYQCEPKRTFQVELFTAATTEALQTHIAKAREVLSLHNIKLEVEVKGISSRFFPLGFDVNLPPPQGSGTVTSKESACKVIGATIAEAGHTAGWMPVFYIPCDAAALGAEAEGAHIKDADLELCESGGTTNLKNLVVIDIRQKGYDQILLHELGHAAGIHPHTQDTFLDPAGRQGKYLDSIDHRQMQQLCNAPFAT